VGKLMAKCPVCNGYKGVSGRSATGHPATLPCERCPNSSGEVLAESLTELERVVSIPIRYDRDDV
jgi:hypothetical protein